MITNSKDISSKQNQSFDPTRLKTYYKSMVVPALKAKWNIENVHAVPQIEKVVVHIMLGKNFKDKTLMKTAEQDIALIANQLPQQVKAKKSVSTWHIRTGMAVGYKVTLRGNKMYQFLDRMLSFALPNYRSFTGLSTKQFDGRGGISVGFTNYNVFKEITFRSQELGLGVNISTTSANNLMAQDLLELMGFPFKNRRDLENNKLYFQHFANPY